MEHFHIQPIEKISEDKRPDAKKLRLERESFWIKELRTLTPYGLNDRLDSKNWRLRSRHDVAGKSFSKLFITRHARGPKTKNRNRSNVDMFQLLKESYDQVKNWRFLLRSKLNAVSIAELKNLSWKFCEYRYDIHKKFPKEIADLALDIINCRLYRDKQEKKKARSVFVKVPFQNKAVENLHLPSILRGEMHLLPEDLRTIDPPTIIYQRSRTIGSIIFNYKDVNTALTQDWKIGNDVKCQCDTSAFKDSHHNHVVTGDLRVIEDNRLRKLLCNGPNFREPQKPNWKKFMSTFQNSLAESIQLWASRTGK